MQLVVAVPVLFCRTCSFTVRGCPPAIPPTDNGGPQLQHGAGQREEWGGGGGVTT